MKTLFTSLIKIFSISLLFLLTLESNAQNFEWVKQIGDRSAEYSNAIAVDSSGNIYLTGYFWGTVDFDPGPDSLKLTSAGGSDIFISKMDSNGNLIWVKQIGGSVVAQNNDLTDFGNSIVTDHLGNLYVSGGFWGTVDFDPGPNTANISSKENSGIFICKFDALGNFQWAKDFGANEYVTIQQSMKVDRENNLYFAGNSYGPVDNSSTDENTQNVAKFDPNGNLIWEQVWWGKYGGFTSVSIAVDSNENVYLAGGCDEEQMDFDPGPDTYYLHLSDNNADGHYTYILKIDSSGSFTWAKQIIVDEGNDVLWAENVLSCDVDRNGNVYVLEYFLSDDNQVFKSRVVKYSNLGNLVWFKQLEGDGSVYAFSLVLDEHANIYITGNFDGTIDFDPGENVVNYDSYYSDIFVTKWDSAGNFIWFNRLWNSEFLATNYGTGIAIYSGDIYATGTFEETITYDLNSTEHHLTSNGNSDILIYKINQIATKNFDNNFNTQVSCYPNPTSDNVDIELGKVYPEIIVSVQNILGQKVILKEFLDTNQFQLSMEGLKAGIYFINLTANNEQKAVFKVLKE